MPPTPERLVSSRVPIISATRFTRAAAMRRWLKPPVISSMTTAALSDWVLAWCRLPALSETGSALLFT